MLRIRLRRVGKRNRPAYRLVVADSRAPRDGAFVDIIGHFDPLTEPGSLTIDEEKAREWLRKGARPSETAVRLLSRRGLVAPPRPVGAKEAPKAAAARAAAKGPAAAGALAPTEQPSTEAATESEAEGATPAGETQPETSAEPASEDAP